MKRISYIALCTVFYAASAFGCRVQFINDSDTTLFAFDENYNDGAIIEPGKDAFFGKEERHPMVILFMRATPENNSLKKVYQVTQIACARAEEDKIVRISAVIKDELPKEIYTITKFATSGETLPCCQHHGAPMNHEMAIDEPLSTMDEE